MFRYRIFILLLAILFACIPMQTARAGVGVMGLGEFEYGASISLDGLYVDRAIVTAGSLGLDWVAVEVHWDTYEPLPGQYGDLTTLDRIFREARERNISVMASVNHVPGWASSVSGPDPVSSANFIEMLARRYTGSLKAIELFPGANTAAGWGAAPDPAAYLTVYKTVRERLANTGLQVYLVAAGLQPIQASTTGGDIDDLIFLQGLYNNGFNGIGEVIGLQLLQTTGEPLFAPDGIEHRILRHYEEVRQVMLSNGHTGGFIWITRLLPPDGSVNSTDGQFTAGQQQAAWLTQAYAQVRSQLYIGVIFHGNLNPPFAGCSTALVQDEQNYHMFYNILREIISQNHIQDSHPLHGRPKDGRVSKNRP